MFVADIVAMHEELVALDNHGRLHQWCWYEQLPFVSATNPSKIFHPKTEELGLADEMVTKMSGSVVRCSVITASNRIATIADASIAPHEPLVEHVATVFPELGDLSTAEISTCSQWTLVTVRNEVYWWGIIPFEQRRRQLDQIQKSSTKRQEEMEVGSVVCLKEQPIFRAGTRAVKLLENQPRVGELTHDVLKYTNSEHEFKVLSTDQLFDAYTPSPPPSSNDDMVHEDKYGTQGKKRKFDEMEASKVPTEKWPLKHVIFLPDENSQNKMVVGKIVRMEGNICAVSFNGAERIKDESLKLLMKDEIMLVGQGSRSPDMVQKTPKKLNIGSNQKVISATIDEESTVHLLMKHTALNKIQYGKYDIGKAEFTSSPTSLPTTPSSFELAGRHAPGPPAEIDHTFGDCPVLLLDAARVHHPLFFTDSTLQDPEWFWLGLPHINALSTSIYNMPHYAGERRERAFVAIVIFRKQILTPIIMSNIPELVRALLTIFHEDNDDQKWSKGRKLILIVQSAHSRALCFILSKFNYQGSKSAIIL